jgi:monoamine oxidase
MRDFLSSLGMSSEHLDAFSLMAGTDSLLCASALELLRDVLGGFFETQALTIEGGMERFPETLTRGMESRIRYGTRVTAVDQNEDGVIHCDKARFA